MCKCTHLFVFAFASIQIYVLSTYVHAIYVYPCLLAYAFGHVYIFMSAGMLLDMFMIL